MQELGQMLTILTSDPSDKSARHKAGDSTATASPTPPGGDAPAIRSRLAWSPRPVRSASRSTSVRCTASAPESGMRSLGWSARSAPRSTDDSAIACDPDAIRHQHARRSGTVTTPTPDSCRRGDPPVVPRTPCRRSTDGSVAPTSSTARTTSCHRRDARRVVSVYDCWFLEHPRDVDADVRRAAAVLRRSVRDGAHVVTSSTATTVRVRELLATDRVHTIHLGPPPVPTIPPGGSAGEPARPRRAARSSSPSARSSVARTSPRSSPRSVASPPSTSTSGWSSPAAPATTSPALDRADQPTRPTPPAESILLGPVTDVEKTWLLASRPDPGLPVARRGVRLSDPRGPTARHARRREHGRIDPGDRGSRGVAQRTARLRGPRRQPVLGRQQRRHARQARPAWSRPTCNGSPGRPPLIA